MDGLIKGAIGAGVFQIASKVINDNGGVAGLVQKFQNSGLGEMANSWIGKGENQAVQPEQVQASLGPDQLNQLAAQLGIPASELAGHLAKVIPQVVDKLTPEGQLPEGPAATAEVSAETVEQVLQSA